MYVTYIYICIPLFATGFAQVVWEGQTPDRCPKLEAACITMHIDMIIHVLIDRRYVDRRQQQRRPPQKKKKQKTEETQESPVAAKTASTKKPKQQKTEETQEARSMCVSL